MPDQIVATKEPGWTKSRTLYFFDTQPFVPVLLLGAAVAAGFCAS